VCELGCDDCDDRVRCLLAVKAQFADSAESDDARFESKQGVVFASTNIKTAYHACAALAYDDCALFCYLAGIQLNTQILCIRVVEVFC
jgi:hypothetical protein